MARIDADLVPPGIQMSQTVSGLSYMTLLVF